MESLETRSIPLKFVYFARFPSAVYFKANKSMGMEELSHGIMSSFGHGQNYR